MRTPLSEFGPSSIRQSDRARTKAFLRQQKSILILAISSSVQHWTILAGNTSRIDNKTESTHRCTSRTASGQVLDTVPKHARQPPAWTDRVRTEFGQSSDLIRNGKFVRTENFRSYATVHYHILSVRCPEEASYMSDDDLTSEHKHGVRDMSEHCPNMVPVHSNGGLAKHKRGRCKYAAIFV